MDHDNEARAVRRCMDHVRRCYKTKEKGKKTKEKENKRKNRKECGTTPTHSKAMAITYYTEEAEYYILPRGTRTRRRTSNTTTTMAGPGNNPVQGFRT
jgi:hypothetical protein